MKKRNLLIVLPVVLLALLVAALAFVGIYASLLDSTAVVENKFQPGRMTASVYADKGVENQGNTPCLCRVKVIINWVDEEDRVLTEAPEGCAYSWTPGKNWTHLGDANDPTDGCWYYDQILYAGGSTGPVIENVNVTGGKLEMKFLAETVQASPSDAAQQLWPEAVYSGGVWKAK